MAHMTKKIVESGESLNKAYRLDYKHKDVCYCKVSSSNILSFQDDHLRQATCDNKLI